MKNKIIYLKFEKSGKILEIEKFSIDLLTKIIERIKTFLTSII